MYATEPSVLLGRIFMEELADFLDRSPKPSKSTRWKTVLRHLPPPLGDLKVGPLGDLWIGPLCVYGKDWKDQ